MTQTNKRDHVPQRPAAGQRSAAEQRTPAPQRPAAPRRTAAPKGGRGGSDLALLLIIGVAAVALSVVLQCIWPNGFPIRHSTDTAVATARQVSEIYSEGPLRINELMTSNRTTITLDGDVSPDWIEVMNISGEDVQLGGYTLSKTADDVRTFTFPQMILGAGECALVYADSRLRDQAGADLHAPFRLSSAGDTLMLFNAHGTAIDTVNIIALQPDQSYVRADTRSWETSDMPTPALANTQANYQMLQQPVEGSPVVVSELMSTNESTYADENGLYYDYIELCNRSGEAVNLDGWYLSDDADSLRKWRIPSLTLQPGACVVIHASKLDRRDDPAHLHTNFGLSSEGETVLLVNPQGRIMDRVEFGLLKADQAWVLGADGSFSIAAATPGRHS